MFRRSALVVVPGNAAARLLGGLIVVPFVENEGRHLPPVEGHPRRPHHAEHPRQQYPQHRPPRRQQAVETGLAVKSLVPLCIVPQEQGTAHRVVSVVGGPVVPLNPVGGSHQRDPVDDERPLGFQFRAPEQVLPGHQTPERRGVGNVGVHAAQLGQVPPSEVLRCHESREHHRVSRQRSAGAGSPGDFGCRHSVTPSPRRSRISGRPAFPRMRPSKSPSARTRARYR